MLLLSLLACTPDIELGQPVMQYRVELYGQEGPVGQATLGRSASGWTESSSASVQGHEVLRRARLDLEGGQLAGLRALGREARSELELRVADEDGAWTRTLRQGARLLTSELDGRPAWVIESLLPPGEPAALSGPALFTWLLAAGEQETEASELHRPVSSSLIVQRREQRDLPGQGPATRWFVHTPAEGWTVWTRDADGIVLAIERTGEALLAEGLTLPRRASPEPPPGVVDTRLSVTRPDVQLEGLLTRPAQLTEAPPTVVLIHGSGPGDRHGNYGPLDTWFFDRLAWALAEAGVQVARYDKRGVGESQPRDPEAGLTQTLDALIADTAAVQDEVGGACHVLIGHSEGGYIAPARAVEDPRVAGVVMLAGPASSLDEIMQQQLTRLYTAHGLPQADIDAMRISQRGMLRTLESGRERDFGPMPMSLEVTLEWLRSHVQHDSEGTLAQVQVPLLALYAGEDLQVPPDTQAPRARELLAGNPYAMVEIQPGVDHLFMPTWGPPGMGLYADPDREVSTQTIERVREFVLNVPCVSEALSAPEGSEGG